MDILILGGGGREHALAFACYHNPKTERLIVAPGNAGIAEIAEITALDIENPHVVEKFVRTENIDFVIIGPEAPLVAGVADHLRKAGISVFGPSAEAARLEASKSFTKEICDAVGAPTAKWARFKAAEPAREHLQQLTPPYVIKADGLAAGKGVTVTEELSEAERAIDAIFQEGVSGASLVIEEYLDGEEASFFVLADGEDILPIGSAQDHKRAFDGDEGPNTGGMGAYSPAPIFTTAIETQVIEQIIRPVLREMARRGTPYKGVLYAGLMIKNGQAKLIEFNARFGDPEAQVLLLRLGGQALDLMMAVAEGRLNSIEAYFAEDHAMVVVLAAKGYPGTAKTGGTIRFDQKSLEASSERNEAVLFHAGTKRNDAGQLIASGGRVLCATARGNTLKEAHERAYALTKSVDWEDGFYRLDIGWRALEKE